MDEKNNNLTTRKTSSIEKQRRNSTDLDQNIKKPRPIGKNSITESLF
jgi:hypothetical protein